MAQVIDVDDPADPRLDDFRDLTTADRRPDRPGGRGLVIAEGEVVVRRLLRSPYPIRSVLGVPRRIAALDADLPAELPCYRTSADVMATVVGFHLNRGVLAVADRAVQPSAAELVVGARVVAVLEGVGDHENLGSIFRNAAGLGVSGVLLGPGCADPLYRRSVRVSMGNVLRVPFASLPDWPAALQWLRDKGFRLLALTPAADAVPLHAVPLHMAIAPTHSPAGSTRTPAHPAKNPPAPSANPAAPTQDPAAAPSRHTAAGLHYADLHAAGLHYAADL
ncbi:MAG TPA: RNA methyltransferase, partial [Pseudonocardiaceae bacterium]